MEKINLRYASIILLVLALSFTFACHKPQTRKSPAAGVYHLVKKNETIESIAGAYGISPQKLLRTNNITDINAVREGTAVFIPSATRVIDNVAPDQKIKKSESAVAVKNYSPDAGRDILKNKKANQEVLSAKQPVPRQKNQAEKTEIYSETQQWKGTDPGEEAVKKIGIKKNVDRKSETSKPEEIIPIDKKRFLWPVRGKVDAQFGIQPNKTYHNWIKIAAKAGTKVKAASFGTVIFSSNLKNYGETIIIRHKDNFATVYTHLKKRYVRIDQNVKKGDAIAVMGEKDDSGDVYMNFEIRLKGKARNPLLFLP